MAKFTAGGFKTLSQGASVTEVGGTGFESNKSETGDAVSITPVPGPCSIAVIMEATYDGVVSIAGSHDGTNFVTINNSITASGGFSIMSPWNYIRAANAAGAVDGKYCTVTIMWVYD